MRISDWSSDVCSSDLCQDQQQDTTQDQTPDEEENRRDRDRHRHRARGRRQHRLDIQAYRLISSPLKSPCGRYRPMPQPVRAELVEAPSFLKERPSSTAFSGATGPCERSEEHTSEIQSLMRTSYAVFCLKKKKRTKQMTTNNKT